LLNSSLLSHLGRFTPLRTSLRDAGNAWGSIHARPQVDPQGLVWRSSGCAPSRQWWNLILGNATQPWISNLQAEQRSKRVRVIVSARSRSVTPLAVCFPAFLSPQSSLRGVTSLGQQIWDCPKWNSKGHAEGAAVPMFANSTFLATVGEELFCQISGHGLDLACGLVVPISCPAASC
jgi:hypothetical protein